MQPCRPPSRDARFLMVVRHAAIVSLSTRKRAGLRSLGAWCRDHLRRLSHRHEPSANHLGYSLLDLARADPFPVGSAHTA